MADADILSCVRQHEQFIAQGGAIPDPKRIQPGRASAGHTPVQRVGNTRSAADIQENLRYYLAEVGNV